MSKSVSVIIPTIKGEVLSLASVPHFIGEVVLSRKAGLGFARNNGAQKAHGKILIFLDDDLIVKEEMWHHALSIKRGEFAMTFLSGFPCTRVMAIHAEDFWSIGGFDQTIQYTGEDRDFYVRALLRGFKFRELPISLVIHNEHPQRARNIHVAIRSIQENVAFIIKYHRQFPQVFRIDFFDRLKRGQARAILILTCLLFHHIMRSVYEATIRLLAIQW